MTVQATRPQQPVPLRPDLRERDEKLDAVKAALLRLAHDFNNTLVPALGYSALLKEEFTAGTKPAKYVQSLENAVNKAAGLVEAILLATRPQRQYRLEDLDLSLLAREKLTAWQAARPQDKAVTVESRLMPCVRRLDSAHFSRLFDHLLANAGEAMPSSGTLRVVLEPRTISDEERAQLGLTSAQVYYLEISDSGSGMDAVTLHRAFEPFFSTRPKGKTGGLGLTIVHSIVQFHSGQIVLESVEGTGTSAKIWIASVNTIPEPKSRSFGAGAPSNT
jgi:signal transduction histidine kinase